MAEASQFVFTFTELARLLVKHQDIHEGNWGIFVRFGISATNISAPDARLVPAAIVPVLELGIQKFDEANPLTVDAAAVNPGKDSKKSKGK
jgi:hypothetical protein